MRLTHIITHWIELGIAYQSRHIDLFLAISYIAQVHALHELVRKAVTRQ